MEERSVKSLDWWGSRGYLWEPKISFVVCNHNMSVQALEIVKDLRKFEDSEIIVIDDGSTHNHTRALVDNMNGVNEFVVHANDLFDVIVFNRVFGFARGDYIAVLQDDDEYKGTDWVTKAIAILDRDKSIAILGGRARVTVNGSGEKKIERDGSFQYAQAINAAPMWIRKSTFLKLGGFSRDFAPMLWHEPDFCVRAWLAGYCVGWYKSGIHALAIATRNRRKNKETLECEARAKNFALLMDRYGDRLDGILEDVIQQNLITRNSRRKFENGKE